MTDYLVIPLTLIALAAPDLAGFLLASLAAHALAGAALALWRR